MDRPIGELDRAGNVLDNDLFVLEQSGSAKSLTGLVLVQDLLARMQSHGGVEDITWTESGTAGNGRIHTGTMHMVDGQTYTFSIQDGVKGNTGTAAHIYIRYAAVMPTQNSDMLTTPNRFIGIYSGTASSAPTSYTSYTWYEIKGETGEPSELETWVAEYQSGTTGTVPPSGTWSTQMPYVAAGNWLWTRITMNFNSGGPVYFYTCARQGVNGEGAASDDIPLTPVSNGSAGTSVNFSRSDHRHPTSGLHIQTNITSSVTTIADQRITENMHVISIQFGTSSAITSDVAWATSNGSLVLSATVNGSTTADIYMDTY